MQLISNPYPEIKKSSNKAVFETNDCCVVALTVALNSKYDDVHSFLSRNNLRVSKRGMTRDSVLKIPSLFNRVKCRVGPYSDTNRITLSNFIKKHSQGRYFVLVRGHALAVVDGVVYDHTEKLRRQVTWAMRVYLSSAELSHT